MRELADSNVSVAQERGESSGLSPNISDRGSLESKFWIALALYAVLAVLVWFTMGADKVPVMGRPVEMRWIPELVLGAFVLRTVVARQAERIRRDGQKDAGSAS